MSDIYAYTPDIEETIKIHLGYFFDPERKDPYQDIANLLMCSRTEAKAQVFHFLWVNHGTVGSDYWWRSPYYTILWLKAELSKATGWDNADIEHQLDEYVESMLKKDKRNETRPVTDKDSIG